MWLQHVSGTEGKKWFGKSMEWQNLMFGIVNEMRQTNFLVLNLKPLNWERSHKCPYEIFIVWLWGDVEEYAQWKYKFL